MVFSSFRLHIKLVLLISFLFHYHYNVHPDILKGYDAAKRGNPAISAQLEALADLKFTYVISCQQFGSQKSSGDPHAQDIIDLMIK